MPVQYLFEPGSTIKPFVSLLALEKKILNDDDTVDCKTWTIKYENEERTIRDSHEMGRLTLKDIIVHSSNVGIARVAERIGKNDLYKNYLNIGFGVNSHIDFDNEVVGFVGKLSDWNQYHLHSVSFGQGMSVNALQLATAYCALANGGYILKPHIINKKINDKGKTYYQAERKVLRTVSNKKYIDQNNSFLLDVVEKGTAKNTKFQYIKIAGKTGTSEKAVDGKYSKTKYTASFAGFFPYENPEYVMVIVYDEPDYNYRFGAASATPTFRNIVEEMVTLPQCQVILDTKAFAKEMIIMPKLVGAKVAEAKKILLNKKIDYQIFNDIEDGFIVSQTPEPGTKFGINSKISLLADKELYVKKDHDIDVFETMPNLVGMPIRKAIYTSKNARINLKIKGSGYVVSQSITPGTKITYQQNCVVVAN
jgi:membrane peptidoglycan carboxypeptidase